MNKNKRHIYNLTLNAFYFISISVEISSPNAVIT